MRRLRLGLALAVLRRRSSQLPFPRLDGLGIGRLTALGGARLGRLLGRLRFRASLAVRRGPRRLRLRLLLLLGVKRGSRDGVGEASVGFRMIPELGLEGLAQDFQMLVLHLLVGRLFGDLEQPEGGAGAGLERGGERAHPSAQNLFGLFVLEDVVEATDFGEGRRHQGAVVGEAEDQLDLFAAGGAGDDQVDDDERRGVELLLVRLGLLAEDRFGPGQVVVGLAGEVVGLVLPVDSAGEALFVSELTQHLGGDRLLALVLAIAGIEEGEAGGEPLAVGGRFVVERADRTFNFVAAGGQGLVAFEDELRKRLVLGQPLQRRLGAGRLLLVVAFGDSQQGEPGPGPTFLVVVRRREVGDGRTKRLVGAVNRIDEPVGTRALPVLVLALGNDPLGLLAVFRDVLASGGGLHDGVGRFGLLVAADADHSHHVGGGGDAVVDGRGIDDSPEGQTREADLVSEGRGGGNGFTVGAHVSALLNSKNLLGPSRVLQITGVNLRL